jgi:hypothetical protein
MAMSVEMRARYPPGMKEEDIAKNSTRKISVPAGQVTE